MKELINKLADVMEAVERIPKRGWNDFHKYHFATEADIAEALRGELSKRKVMLIPSIVGESRHPVGEKGSVLTVLEMEMEFYDGESGQSIKKPWRGYGTDKEDKGGYKAMTGGEKYFLLKTFLMPTGDDPEADHEPGSKPAAPASRQQPPQRTAAPQRPAAAPARPAAQAVGSVRVIDVKVAKKGTSAKGPWTLVIIKFSDGREGKTFSKSVHEAAVKAYAEEQTVDVTLDTKGTIVKMEPVFQQREAS